MCLTIASHVSCIARLSKNVAMNFKKKQDFRPMHYLIFCYTDLCLMFLTAKLCSMWTGPDIVRIHIKLPPRKIVTLSHGIGCLFCFWNFSERFQTQLTPLGNSLELFAKYWFHLAAVHVQTVVWAGGKLTLQNAEN